MNDVVAYKVLELGPCRAPATSGWRLGCVTAVSVPQRQVTMRPWPNPYEHPMLSDWRVHCKEREARVVRAAADVLGAACCARVPRARLPRYRHESACFTVHLQLGAVFNKRILHASPGHAMRNETRVARAIHRPGRAVASVMHPSMMMRNACKRHAPGVMRLGAAHSAAECM